LIVLSVTCYISFVSDHQFCFLAFVCPPLVSYFFCGLLWLCLFTLLGYLLLNDRRARLYRFATTDEGNEWKERGTGTVKILKHKETGKQRVLMRRDKTFKICANHAILPVMKLEENAGSDRSWVYPCPADFADGEAKKETFAIRLLNKENALKFREVFDAAREATESAEKKDEESEKKEE